MKCPCRCGATIEMLIADGARPRWDIVADAKGRPTLQPSVWRNAGCKSHFWVRTGRIVWCGESEAV
ncbi:DUF6527 family protein [Pelagibacterium lacus]